MQLTDLERNEIQNLLYGYDCEYIPQLKEATNKIFDYVQKLVGQIEPPVKPACENCIHLKVEGGKLYAKTELCQNSKIRLWNLTNCDIDITEFGCTYFESKSV